jgi:hypothetical protein
MYDNVQTREPVCHRPHLPPKKGIGKADAFGDILWRRFSASSLVFLFYVVEQDYDECLCTRVSIWSSTNQPGDANGGKMGIVWTVSGSVRPSQRGFHTGFTILPTNVLHISYTVILVLPAATKFLLFWRNYWLTACINNIRKCCVARI